MKYILSFGGGVNSVALYFTLKKHDMPIDEIIFADTGTELPETYEVVEKFKKIAVIDRVVFSTVKSDLSDNLYSYYWDKKCVPSRMRRDCTAKFKIRAMRKYLRNKYGKEETFTQYIGIALEEFHRMKNSDVKYCTLVYPLVDKKIDREECKRINQENGFAETTKSGCYVCPFTRKQGWIDLLKNHPGLFDKTIALQHNCPNPKLRMNLEKFKQVNDPAQLKIEEFEHTCDVAGNCFL